MSKFSKKSLAVLTTAAIMASTASVVAYAAGAVTWTSDKITEVQKFDVDSDDYVAFTSGNANKIRFKVAEGTEVVGLTANAAGWYVIDGISAATNLDDYIKKAGGGEGASTPAGDENFDGVVWVGGKDTKAQAAKNDKPATPASLFKTEAVQVTGNYAGGKWQVAVTDDAVADVATFIGMFDTKAKFTKASDYKDLASAKIKDGVVTVTAGKKAGAIKVWVYEVNQKKVVSASVKDDTKTVQIGEVDVISVTPDKGASFVVKVAPTKFALTKDETKAAAAKIEKTDSVSKETVLLKTGLTTQETQTYYIANLDTKAMDATATFTIGAKSKYVNGDDAVVNAALEGKTLTVTPVKAGSASIEIVNNESGKSAKLAVTVVAGTKVTLTPEAVTANVSFKYKDENKKDVEVKTAGDVYITANTVVEVIGEKADVTGATLDTKNKFKVAATAVTISAKADAPAGDQGGDNSGNQGA